jgi:hypothetical protein
MNAVIVFTSKTLEVMFDEGGCGYWNANRKRLDKCFYVIATKSNTLRERFPGNTSIKQDSAFFIGKISNITASPDGKRSLIQLSQYAEFNIPNAWVGNRNPVTYTDINSFQSEHKFDTTSLEWLEFPTKETSTVSDIKPLTINEAKEGIAKTLGIDSSCIEIQIKT